MVFKNMMKTRHTAQQRALIDGEATAPAASAELVNNAHVEPPTVVPSAPVAAARPDRLRANRIADIIANAGKQKASNTDKAAMVRDALSVSAGRMKAMQRAGA